MTSKVYWYDGAMSADDLSALELFINSGLGDLAGISECFHTSVFNEEIRSKIEKKISRKVYDGAQRPIIARASCVQKNLLNITEKKPEKGYAWDTIYSTAKENGTLTLLCAGSLTNIALSILRHDDLKNFVERIVFIAGTVGIGDTLAMSEKRAALDPYAMKTVLTSGVKLLSIGKGSWASDRVTPFDMVSSLINLGKLEIRKAHMDIETVRSDQLARTIIDTRTSSKADKNIEYVFIDNRK